MREVFQEILTKYKLDYKTVYQIQNNKNKSAISTIDKERNERKQSELYNYYTVELKQSFLDQTSPLLKDYDVQIGVGAGRWTTVPYIAIMDNVVTSSPTMGYYVVYLFREDMTGFYLSLNQGEGPRDEKFNSSEYKLITRYWQNLLIGSDTTSSFNTSPIDLRTKNRIPKEYETRHIIGKFYSADDLVSKSELYDDLVNILELYKKLREVYNNHGSTQYNVNKQILDNYYFEEPAAVQLPKARPKRSPESRICTPNADVPTTKDRLNRKAHVLALARLIANANTDTPLTIGLFAGWGEGKSSFLEQLQEKLDIINHQVVDKDKNEFLKTTCIPIDASQYDDSEKMWASILQSMYDAYAEESRAGTRYFIKKHLNGRNIFSFLIKILILSLLVTLIVFLYKPAIQLSGNKSIIDLLKNATVVSLISGTGVTILFLLISCINKIFKVFPEKTAHALMEFFSLPDYSKHLGFKNEVKKDINRLLEIWLLNKKEKTVREKLVIIIDELDRCSKEKINETLEAIQMFLSLKGVIVILSVNFKVTCLTLAEKYNFMFDEGIGIEKKLGFGMDYLEKYVNIPIYLSKSVSYKDYYEELIRNHVKIISKEETLEGKSITSNNNNIVDTLENQKVNTNGVKVQDDADRGLSKENLQNDSDNSYITENLKPVEFERDEAELLYKLINRLNQKRLLNPREIKRIVNTCLISKGIYSEVIGDEEFKDYLRCFIFSYFDSRNYKHICNYVSEDILDTDLSLNELKEELVVEEILKSTDLIDLIEDIRVYQLVDYQPIIDNFIFYSHEYNMDSAK